MWSVRCLVKACFEGLCPPKGLSGPRLLGGPVRFGSSRQWSGADQVGVNDRHPRPPQHLVMAAVGVIFLTHMVIGQDLADDSWQQHARSPTWALGIGAGIALMLALSRNVAGISLIVAGATGNLVSWADDGKVPNYMTAVVGDRWIAFNLADVSIVVGLLTVISTLVIRAEYQIRGSSTR